MPPIGSVRTFRRKGSVPMPEPTLSEDKALELMEQCLLWGLKEWAVVTDLRARVTLLERSLEQMYQENRGNGP